MQLQDIGKERQCPRTVSLDTIRFCLADDLHGELRLATTINVSDTGMCFYTLNRLREGDVVIIKDDFSLSFRKAIVRWVKNYGKTLCKAGLMFIK